MKNNDIQKLENFDFSAFLYDLKKELNITFKQMAELSDVPYTVLYKYTSGAKPRPSLNDFYKIMQFANRSIDDFFLKLLKKPHYYEQIHYYFNHLSEAELALLNKLNELENEHKELFLMHILDLLDMMI
ncbi:helix-turn-helix domain-containing protein [bacterium c-19]|nr:helix-turn-helix domain-containing protein [bacterium c-19]